MRAEAPLHRQGRVRSSSAADVILSLALEKEVGGALPAAVSQGRGRPPAAHRAAPSSRRAPGSRNDAGHARSRSTSRSQKPKRAIDSDSPYAQ